MIRRLISVCAVASVASTTLLAQTPSETVKRFAHPNRIRYDGRCLAIDGRGTFIRSAKFHYFRTPPELRRDRFQKIQDAGFDTVDTHVPWDWHERESSSCPRWPRGSGFRGGS